MKERPVAPDVTLDLTKSDFKRIRGQDCKFLR